MTILLLLFSAIVVCSARTGQVFRSSDCTGKGDDFTVNDLTNLFDFGKSSPYKSAKPDTAVSIWGDDACAVTNNRQEISPLACGALPAGGNIQCVRRLR